MSDDAVVAAASTGAPRGVRLFLLNGFDLRLDDTSVVLPLAAQRLMAFLGLRERQLTRVYVAGTLWPDASEERSRSNLRATLWRLRRPNVSLVEASSTHVGLGRVAVDVSSLVATSQRLLRDGFDECGTDIDQTSLTGELLPDWYDDWVVDERDRLRQLQLHALEALAEGFVAEKRYGQAVEAAFAAIRAEPLRESAERLLIRVHLAEGNHGEALQRYLCYHRRLREAIGLEPSPQMGALIAGLAHTAKRRRRDVSGTRR